MSDLTSINIEPWQEAILRFADQSHKTIVERSHFRAATYLNNNKQQESQIKGLNIDKIWIDEANEIEVTNE